MNKYIQDKYPEMSFGKCNMKTILSSENSDRFRAWGYYINLERFYIKNMRGLLNLFTRNSIILNVNRTHIITLDENYVLKHYSKNLSNKIKLCMIPESWGIVLEIENKSKIVSHISDKMVYSLLYGQIFTTGDDLFDKFIKKT